MILGCKGLSEKILKVTGVHSLEHCKTSLQNCKSVNSNSEGFFRPKKS